jgi:hypothetical protein
MAVSLGSSFIPAARDNSLSWEQLAGRQLKNAKFTYDRHAEPVTGREPGELSAEP